MAGARKQPELGERNSFTFRYGPEVPIYGHRRRGDPGSIQLAHFEYLQNVRFNDGISGRPGSELMINGLGGGAGGGGDTEDSIVSSLFDFQCTGAAGKLYIVYQGAPGCAGSSAGASLNWASFDNQAPFGRGVYFPTAVGEPAMGVFDGDLYLGIDAVLSVFISINPDYEDEALFVTGFGQAEALKTFTGFTITCMCAAFGELYIGLDSGAPGTSKVVRYNGVTFTDDQTGIDAPSSISLFRDESLVVGIATGGLEVRSEDGTWATIAGAVAPTKQESYRDLLYMVEDGPDIWTFDGTVIANVHTIAGAEISSLASLNGLLYYGYGSVADTGEAVIGSLDEDGVFVDVVKNITDQDSLDVNFDGADKVTQLSFYKGSLVAGVSSGSLHVPGYGGRLFFGPGDDIDGDWTALTPFDVAAPAFFNILAFETF